MTITYFCIAVVALSFNDCWAGLLKVGKPLSWGKSLPYLNYVREHGVIQFINRYHSVKEICNDDLKWGDEIEYSLFEVDEMNKKVSLSLRASEIRDNLNDLEKRHAYRSEGCIWHPEYGAWMIESTPSTPFRGYVNDLLRVEFSMRMRRTRLLSVLKPSEIAPTVSVFPGLGVTDGLADSAEAMKKNLASRSQYISDEFINPHPRFAALTNNIRSRRGSKVDIRVPIFEDVNTPEYQQDAEGEKYVHMDAMGFGMGCCCLQLTFQARDVEESRYMYDQLAVLSPVMLALSAATPIFRGRLVDTDVRWNVISASVDDRTDMERGACDEVARDDRMAGGGVKRLLKSRYDSISTFIHHCETEGEDCRAWNLNLFNDIDCPIDESSYQTLLSAGIDKPLAKHIAHLFTRDPLVIFEGRISELNDEKDIEHFENIQSTNWQTVRWKPPPLRRNPNDPHIGWRTEFRSLELQLTDFENAAYVVFVVLVTRVILAFDLCLYIPLSKVDANMELAHRRDSLLNEKFSFRICIDPLYSGTECLEASNNVFDEMTVAEILMGKESSVNDFHYQYPGLIPLVYAYLEYIGADARTLERIEAYLDLLHARATGKVMTAAKWIRQFVMKHPQYRGDSVITDEICFDLMLACKDIGEGRKRVRDLIGDEIIEPIRVDEAYDIPLLSSRINAKTRRELIKRYARGGRRATENLNNETASGNFSSVFEGYDSEECIPFDWTL